MGDSAASARRFLTVEQVAEELNVETPAIGPLLKTGELRGIQVGARSVRRIGVTDLEDFIAHAYQQMADRTELGNISDENQSGRDARSNP